jgi:hypothetical protein
MRSKARKKTAISKQNYPAIKKLGGAGDSFNDKFTGALIRLEKNFKADQTQSNQNNQIYTVKSSESNQTKEPNSIVIKSLFVTTCLTNSHDECTGSYEYGLGEFKIECHCDCHNNSDLHSVVQKRDLRGGYLV